MTERQAAINARRAASIWSRAADKPKRKPYTRPSVTIGPRDAEDVIDALCARNPYM